MFELNPQNPLRPPHWRWQRALQLAEGAPVSRQADDIHTRLAGRFRKRLLAAQLDPQLQLTLQTKFTDLYLAHTVAVSSEPAYRELRNELEARILTNESVSVLASRLGFRQTAVEAYERMFFDVRERLGRPAYILHFIIGSTTCGQLTERMTGVLWKLFGYYGGPICLDVLISGFEGQDLMVGMTTTETLDSLIALRQRQKMLVGAATIPINVLTQQIIWDSWHKLRQHEQTAQTAGAQRNGILANVEALLKLQPFGVGKQIEPMNAKAAKKLEKYESGAELRGDELHRIGLGQDLPANVATLLAEMAFPEVIDVTPS